MKSLRPALLVALALPSVALAGCVDNFDPRLYQAREAEAGAHDAGMDAGPRGDGGADAGLDASANDAGFDAFANDVGIDGGSDAGMDAGPFDAGADAAIPPLALADFCTTPSSVPVIPRPALATDAVSAAFLVDTTGLVDDVSAVAACTGAVENGHDGFASVMMLAGERWHFHLRRPTGGANAALYVLDSSCDERTCSGGAGQDLCGNSSDEHFSFVAPSTGLYFVGVDSEAVGGFMGELDVIHPVCGDHMKQHSEGCDDGNTMGGDGCDAVCRTELASGATEAEANDDAYSANHLILAASGASTVLGHIASACESDTFAFDVPAGETGNITVSLGLTAGGCPASNVVPVDLVVLGTDGSTVLATTTLGAGGGCPMVGGGGSPLAALPAGTYYARVRSIAAAAPSPALDYRLTITPVFTP